MKFDESKKLYQGTATYLGVLYEFYDAYTSKDPAMTLAVRLEKLSFVLFFFRYWNIWLDSPGMAHVSRDVNGISHQAMCDLEICVGAFFTVVAILGRWPRFQQKGVGRSIGAFIAERLVCMLC